MPVAPEGEKGKGLLDGDAVVEGALGGLVRLLLGGLDLAEAVRQAGEPDHAVVLLEPDHPDAARGPLLDLSLIHI